MLKNNANLYMHNLDRDALQSLKSVPAFGEIMKFVMKYNFEVRERIRLMTGSIRLSEKQLPEYYRLLPPICEKLGIDVPELYLEEGDVNAYTTGETKPMIVLYTGLLKELSSDEVMAVLAHECGHIACHHILYHNVALKLVNGTFGDVVPREIQALVSVGVRMAFAYWYRCSEFSADRASAIAVGNAKIVQDVMIKLSGLSPYITDREEFLKQGEECMQYIQSSTWNKLMNFDMIKEYDHPTNAARAFEIEKWCNSDEFIQLSSGNNLLSKGTIICPKCKREIDSAWAFCKLCGQKL